MMVIRRLSWCWLPPTFLGTLMRHSGGYQSNSVEITFTDWFHRLNLQGFVITGDDWRSGSTYLCLWKKVGGNSFASTSRILRSVSSSDSPTGLEKLLESIIFSNAINKGFRRFSTVRALSLRTIFELRVWKAFNKYSL